MNLKARGTGTERRKVPPRFNAVFGPHQGQRLQLREAGRGAAGQAILHLIDGFGDIHSLKRFRTGQRIDAFVINPGRRARKSGRHQIAGEPRGLSTDAVDLTAEQLSMLLVGAHHPQAVAEPPQPDWHSAKLGCVAKQVKPRVRVPGQCDGRGHLHGHLCIGQLREIRSDCRQCFPEEQGLARAEASVHG